jgi:uncharacterized membrane protein (UPF0182 family)
MAVYRIPSSRRSRTLPGGRATLIVAVLLLLLASRSIASYVVDYQWWKELGQVSTWLSMMAYSVAPVTAAALLAFAALWVAHARAVKFAGSRLGEFPI